MMPVRPRARPQARAKPDLPGYYAGLEGKGGGCDPAAICDRECGPASAGLLELGVVGGLVLAGVVKSGLRYGWRRLIAPPGRHRGAVR
jgi:hypothetical protein